MTRLARRLRVWCALVLLAPLLSACLEPDRTTIAVMMASTSDESWQRVVWPTFKRRVQDTCGGCHITTYDAKGDAQTQVRQLKSALADKVDAIVLEAVSSETGEELVVNAGEVPVISYRRFIPGADYGVTLNEEAIAAGFAGDGSAATKPGQQPRVVVLGSGQDADVNQADSVSSLEGQLVGAGVRVSRIGAVTAAALARTPASWVVAGSAEQVEAAVAAVGKLPSRQRPKIAAHAVDLVTMQRLIRGEIAQSVFVPEAKMMTSAADIAVALVTKEDPPDTQDLEGVPTIQFAAEPLRLANLTSTVVKEGRYSLDELCDATTTKRCQALGLV